MKLRLSHPPGGGRAGLQMTSMIDIVFLLLTFFLMTFQIARLEGDFNIRMPRATAATAPPSLPVVIHIWLMAADDGTLTGIRLEDRRVADMDDLHAEIRQIVGDPEAWSAGPEVQLHCDGRLAYRETIRAVTAVSGYLDDRGRRVTLVERIRLAGPR